MSQETQTETLTESRGLMMLKDVILEADSEHEIFFLVTAYLEALHHCDRLDALPGYLKRMPLGGPDDLKTRFERARAELSKYAEQRESWPRLVFEEAAEVFRAALNRLQRLGQISHPAWSAQASA